MFRTNRPKAIFLGEDPHTIEMVFTPACMERVNALLDVVPGRVSTNNFESLLDELYDVEVIIGTWGLTPLTETQIAKLPHLKTALYAAGSVRSFAEPFIHSGVHVISAWAANAVPVAEYTLSQILLSCKGYFANTRKSRDPAFTALRGEAPKGRGNYGARVALLGFGMIGKKTAEFLRPFNHDLVVFDPFSSEELIASYGARKVTLEEAFDSYVVSNHIANIPETVGMLDYALFERLPRDATFINTGRGAQVVEPDLIRLLTEREDVTALLDVTWPEPPKPDSPFYTLPNCQLTTHIAGSLNDELARMVDTALDEFERMRDGKSPRYSVTLEMLKTMA